MFVCTIAGQSVRVGDLEAGIFAQIEKDTGVPWSDVYRGPIRNIQAGSLLYQACAKQLGVDPPNPITVDDLIDAFALADDTVPEGEGGQAVDPSEPGDGA